MPRRNQPDDVSGDASGINERRNAAGLESSAAANDPPTTAPQASPFRDFCDIPVDAPTVRRVIAREHDTIVFMFPRPLTMDQVEHVRAHVRGAFAQGTNVLILSDGVNVEVIGRRVDVPDDQIAAVRDRFLTVDAPGDFDAIGFAHAVLALAEGEHPGAAELAP